MAPTRTILLAALVAGATGCPSPDPTPSEQAPSTPTSVSAIASAARIDLSWAPSTGTFVMVYRVYRNGYAYHDVSTSPFADTGLLPSTRYCYEVSALDVAGNESPRSAPAACATTPASSGDTQAPSVPSGLTATAQSSSRIDLSWQPSTDNVGVAGYRVYRSGSLLATTASTSSSDTGLAAVTQYCYAVSAFDAAGNESARTPQQCATTLPAGGPTFTLTVQKTGSGTVTGSSISCGTTCSATYASGTSVTLTASPASGSTFGSWTGCDSTTGSSCTVTMNANRSVSATFGLDTTPRFELGALASTSATGAYTVTWSCVSAICQNTITLQEALDTSFTSPQGYYFSSAETSKAFSGKADGTYCYRVAGTGYTNWSTPKCITVARTNPALTVSKSGTGSGTVTSSPAGISCGATCSASYATGTSVTLTATPDAGSTFAGWTNCDVLVLNGACQMSMTAAKTVTATFSAGSTTCTPNATRCVAGNVNVQETCNSTGTVWAQQACPSWNLCTKGSCHFVCEARAGTPANPSVCFVPNADGVNDGVLYYSNSSLLGPGTVNGGAWDPVSSGTRANISSSDRDWPYSWVVSSSGQANAQFKLNQFGSQRTVTFYYGARKTNTLNYSAYAFVGAYNASSWFWSNASQSLSSFWLDTGWVFDTARSQWNYAGGWNAVAVGPTGAGFGDPVDLVDIEYVAVEVAP